MNFTKQSILSDKCWTYSENVKYADVDNMGYLIGGVEIAKAACFATGKCVAFSCNIKNAEEKCWLKYSFANPRINKKTYSYHWSC